MVAANNLVLNLDKMNVMKFRTRNSSHFTLNVGYKEECIEDRVLQIDNNIKIGRTILRERLLS
jgi:hypothetical protein